MSPVNPDHIATKTNRIRVAATQCAFTDRLDENVARVEALVREAAARGAQVILPSELFEGLYFCREEKDAFFDWAKPAAGHPTIARFQQLARELGVVIPVSFFERDGQAFYNSLAMVDADGSMLGIYRKSHIPDGARLRGEVLLPARQHRLQGVGYPLR